MSGLAWQRANIPRLEILYLNLRLHLISLPSPRGGTVEPGSRFAGRRRRPFHTTRWSAVLLSAQSQASGSQAALAELCRIYWYPIYAFVRRHGSSPEDAQDLTQGFFLHLLDHKALRQVSPLKGKFRSFLVASLQNYLSDEADRARCLKRGGKIEFVPLDTDWPKIVIGWRRSIF